jgi:hypothetical protein
MGRDPTEQPTSDLFPTATVGDASARRTLPDAKATTQSTPRRHILPKDQPNAVKHLSDRELDWMLAAMLGEIKRRANLRTVVKIDLETLRHRFDARPNLIKKKSTAIGKRRVVENGVPLTRGQVNAVSAAFKAGITPSRIAREFGLSQSSVWKSLKSDESKKP